MNYSFSQQRGDGGGGGDNRKGFSVTRLMGL